MRLLNLTRGYTAIVDDADYERVAAFKWFAHVVRYPDGRIKRVAAARQERPISGGPQRTIYLHRWLLGVVNPLIQVDHESTNALDDRRDNLRICTNSQNSRNRNRHHDNKSGYKGVCWKPREKKWVAQITVDGRQRHLGYFDLPQDAAVAYNHAAIELFGRFARLNENLRAA